MEYEEVECPNKWECFLAKFVVVCFIIIGALATLYFVFWIIKKMVLLFL